MLAVESNHGLAAQSAHQDSSGSERQASSSTSPHDRTELDDLLDELLGQAAACSRSAATTTPPRTSSPGSSIQQACSQARRRPVPMVRNDSLSALRLTPPFGLQPPLQPPLHTRLQIDIEVDQKTGSARVDSWSPVSFDSVPAGTTAVGYGNNFG